MIVSIFYCIDPLLYLLQAKMPTNEQFVTKRLADEVTRLSEQLDESTREKALQQSEINRWVNNDVKQYCWQSYSTRSRYLVHLQYVPFEWCALPHRACTRLRQQVLASQVAKSNAARITPAGLLAHTVKGPPRRPPPLIQPVLGDVEAHGTMTLRPLRVLFLL